LHARTLTALSVSAVAILGAWTASAIAAPHAAQASPVNHTTQASFLFTAWAPKAQMTPVEGVPGTYTFTMPLRSAEQAVVWFTDRPVRDAGMMPMNAFVGLWAIRKEKSFATDPPNVAIEYVANGRRRAFIATMTAPVIQSAGSGADATVLQATMTAVPVDQVRQLAAGTRHIGIHAKRATLDPSLPPVHQRVVTLFIDGVALRGKAKSGVLYDYKWCSGCTP